MDADKNIQLVKSAVRAGLIIAVSCLLLLLPPINKCFALPEVENVVSGEVNFVNIDSQTLQINASDKAIINYKSFNILENESVIVSLPNQTSDILNRVTGPDISAILGRLICNGTFILVNQNGINIGPNAQIDAGSFIASTRDITNENFLKSQYVFEKFNKEKDNALIKNQGSITIRRGGFGVLIAGAIENQGSIIATVGTVALASGDQVRLGISDGGLIGIAIEKEVASQILDANGNPITNQISNTGTIEAKDGIVFIRADSAVNLFKNAINLEGKINADRVNVRDGLIEITSNRDIKIAGEITGNNIKITADYDGDGAGSFIQTSGVIESKGQGNVYIDGSGTMTLGEIRSDLGFIKIGTIRTPTEIDGLPAFVHTNGDLIITDKQESGTTTILTTSRGDILRYDTNGTVILETKAGKVYDLTLTPIKAQYLKIVSDGFLINSSALTTEILKNQGDLTIQDVKSLNNDLINLEGEDLNVTYNKNNNLTLGSNSAINTAAGLIIPANQLKVAAKYFGSLQTPLNLNAAAIHILLLAGDIDIISTQGIGTSILITGPPTFGSITYNKDSNLILETQEGNIKVSENNEIYANNLTLKSNKNINSAGWLIALDTIELSANGAITSTGKLKAQNLIEKAASFVVGGISEIKQASIINEDNAVTLTSGNFSGTYSDAVNIIIDTNAIINLTGNTIFQADSNADGSGAFIMNSGSSIDGNGYTLTIYASDASTLRSITSVGSLTLRASQSGSNPTYTVYNTISINSTITITSSTLFMNSNDLVVNTITLSSATLRGANYYVDDTGGNDSNSGTSPEKAWKTISKVNAATFKPGDNVLFKRGGTWRGQLLPDSGSSTGYITYGAYGTGDKPLLLGSKQENQTSDWVYEGNNIWRNSDSSFTVDVGNLIFNNEESVGVKKQAVSELNQQGDFWYDFTNNLIKIYSVGNPASVYTNIEAALKIGNAGGVIRMVNDSYIIIENFDIRYGAMHGISTDTCSNIIIRDNNISYIGGADQSGSYTVRLGNGIQFWNGIQNALVERNTLSQIYDAAITPQGSGTGYDVSNVIMRNNIIDTSEYSFEYWVASGSTTNGVYFVNNTCTNAGGAWAHNQRWDGPNGRHVRIAGLPTGATNQVIMNNIFDGATHSAYRFTSSSAISKMDIDYNLFYNVTAIGNIGTNTYATLSSWRTISGQDAHSISANPQFVDKTSGNLKLQSSSPAINAGTNLYSIVPEDFIKTQRPSSSGYEIGAYEYIVGGTPSSYTFSGTGSWSTASLWSSGIVPGAGAIVIIDGIVSLTSSILGLDTVTINSGRSLNLAGYNIGTINGITNNGTLSLLGNESITGGLTNSALSTVEYKGSGSYSSLAAGNNYHNLIFNGTGSWTLASDLNVSGAFQLMNGNFISAAHTVNIQGTNATYKDSDVNSEKTDWTDGTLNIQTNIDQALPQGEIYNNIRMGRYDDASGTTTYTSMGSANILGTWTRDNNTAILLTISASGINKIYDGNTIAAVNLTNNGVIGKYGIDSYNYTAVFNNKNAGSNKIININGISISGMGAENYTFNTAASATANITPRPLTITATGIDKIYDGTAIATVALSDNKIIGDTLFTSYATALFSNKNVGDNKLVSVGGISISGTDAGNYTFNTATSTTANITPRPLTIIATGTDKVYDGTTQTMVNLYNNKISTDILTVTYASASFSDKNTGNNKQINITGISILGIDAGNYTFNTSAQTSANITPKTLTITAIGIDKVYDGTTTSTVNLFNNKIAGDLLTVSYSTASFSNKNVGNDKPVSITGISISGTDAGNYTFNTATSTTADITPRSLTISAMGIDKIYDGTATATVTLSDNRIFGDTLTAIYTTAQFSDKNIGNDKPVTVNGISISGTDSGNYTFNTTAQTTANILNGTLTFSGTGSWSTASLWSSGIVPGAGAIVIIDGIVSLTSSILGLDTVTINSGRSLNLAGYNIGTINGITNNGTLSLLGNESITGGLTNSALSTVEYKGSGSYSSLAAGNNYHNLIFNGTGSWTLASGTTTVANLLDINQGTAIVNTGSTLDVNYDDTDAIDILSGATLRVNGGTLTVDGGNYSGVHVNQGGFLNIVSGTATIKGSLNLEGRLQMAGGVLTVGNTTDNKNSVNILNIGSLGGAFAGDITGGTIYLQGNYSSSDYIFFVNDGGKFLPQITSGNTGNLVVMNPSSKNYIRNQSSTANYMNVAFNRLQIGDAANNNSYIAFSSSNTAPLYVNNTFTIYSGSTFDQKVGNNDPVYLNNLINNGTYIGSTTTNVSGNWTNNGTFTANTGTVILKGTGLQQIKTGGSASTFNILTITNISTSGIQFTDALYTATLNATSGVKKLSFATGSSIVHTITTTFNVAGTNSSNRLILAPLTSGKTWYLNAPTSTVRYVSVSYSREATGKRITAIYSYNGGHNTNWTIRSGS